MQWLHLVNIFPLWLWPLYSTWTQTVAEIDDVDDRGRTGPGLLECGICCYDNMDYIIAGGGKCEISVCVLRGFSKRSCFLLRYLFCTFLEVMETWLVAHEDQGCRPVIKHLENGQNYVFFFLFVFRSCRLDRDRRPLSHLTALEPGGCYQPVMKPPGCVS